MNDPRSQRYSFEQEYYLPERVFLSNLLQCCECDSNIVFERITTAMQGEVNTNVNYIFEIIKDVERRHATIKEGQPEHLLPNDFINFVKQNCEKTTEREKHYFLLQCYQRIPTVVSWVEKLSEKLDARPRYLHEDKRLLKIYQDTIMDLCAVSRRESFRIKTATGALFKKKKPQINTYSDNQNKILRFAMEKVLPDVFINSDSQALSSLASKSWHDVTCKSTLVNGAVGGVIVIDSNNGNDFIRFMRSQFDVLKKIEKNQNPDEKLQLLGETLLAIYNKLSVCHQNGVIRGLKDDYIPNLNFNYVNKKTEPTIDSADYELDSYISAHIINFLEHSNGTYEKKPSFMESIDRVIEKIRPKVLEQIGVTITLEEFRKFMKEGCTGNSLFLWPCCIHLVPMLINALFDEPIIFMKCHENGRSI